MSDKPKRTMPKGGKKGGTRFPRVNIQQAFEYTKRLVSKTQTGSQPESILLKGVFDNAGPLGKVRSSALRQYNLLQGDLKGYESTKLAKELVGAPEEERITFLRQALLTPKIFSDLYETFKGDSTSLPKIRQQAIKLNVHLDLADECVKIFSDSILACQLGTKEGENIKFSLTTIKPTPNLDENLNNDDNDDTSNGEKGANNDSDPNSGTGGEEGSSKNKINTHVNISVDPSMDPEKLEKLLKLLKQYGAL